ncbi:MAG TPA: PHB depolymerase family esterase [Longimicrobiales bacterium]
MTLGAVAALAAACDSDPAEPGMNEVEDPMELPVDPPELPEPCDAAGVAGDPYVGGVNCRTVEVDGYPRQYLVYVPPGHTFTAASPAPVVLMFHGGSQTGERFYRLSRWKEKADEVGLIAVFPTALRHYLIEDDRWATQWHDYYVAPEIDPTRRPAGYPEDAPWPADDVAFARAILDDLESTAYADPERMYATGFSNGASMTARLAIEATDRIAAFAYVAGRFCDPVDADWTAAPPRPAILVLGTIDGKILGHIVDGDTTAFEPLPLDADSLLDHDALVGCLESAVAGFDLAWEPYDVLELNGQTNIEWSTPLGQPWGNSFRLIVLGGLGHRYPNGENNPLEWDAADRFWEFFRDLRLTP